MAKTHLAQDPQAKQHYGTQCRESSNQSTNIQTLLDKYPDNGSLSPTQIMKQNILRHDIPALKEYYNEGLLIMP